MLSYNSLLAWNKTAFLCAGCVSECFGVGKPYRFFSQSTFKDLWIKCSVPSVSQTASWLGTEAGILRFSSELSILPQHTAVTLAPLVPIPWSVWGCGSEVLFDFFQSLPPPPSENNLESFSAKTGHQWPEAWSGSSLTNSNHLGFKNVTTSVLLKERHSMCYCFENK